MGSHASRRTPAAATTPTPTPTDDAQRVFDHLRRLVRYLRLAARKAEDATGISSAQLFVLQQLAAAPSSSLADLAARTLTDASSVSTVVARLVGRGLVARKAVAGDRRKAALALTPRGRLLVARAPELPQTRIAGAIERMSPAARRSAVTALDALVRAIGADQLEPRMFFEDERR